MDSFSTLHELARNSAAQNPSKIALSGSDGDFTYGEIDQFANKIAHKLVSVGIKKGDRVAIYLDKSAQSVIIFQGILRAGAIYVPIDLQVPIAGVLEIFSGCTPRAIFTTEKFAEQLDEKYDQKLEFFITSNNDSEPFSWMGEDSIDAATTFTPVASSEDDPAYILYTSGSTGKPKGVCLSHKNALSFIYWAADITNANAEHIFANHAPFSFGISVYDLYVPFLVGGKLVIVPSLLSLSAKRLVEFVVDKKITHWYSVPSAILLMMQSDHFIESMQQNLQSLMFAGEPFPKAPLNELRRNLPQLQMLNFYGATETNVSCYYEVKEEIPDSILSVPIGRAACGNKVWIENTDKHNATHGELIVQGPTVMLGYWGTTLKTERPYCTCDTVCEDNERNLHYLGRTDNIVKIKGYRVALSEIENTILKHPDIHQVAVIKTGEDSSCKLIAYASLIASATEPGLLEIKQLCAEFLPQYKIIHKIIFLDELPLNNNSKVDRRCLTEMTQIGITDNYDHAHVG